MSEGVTAWLDQFEVAAAFHIGEEVTSYELIGLSNHILEYLYGTQGTWSERLATTPPLQPLRNHLVGRGGEIGYLALMDSILISGVPPVGRWEQADQILERCLEAYTEHVPAQTFLRTYLAELRTFEGRWDEATEQLEIAKLALEQHAGAEPTPMWFEANCRVAEMRGRVELSLGHLIPAHSAFSEGIEWAGKYQAAAEASLALGSAQYRPGAVFEARIALAFGMSELLLFTERYEEVIDKLTPILGNSFLEDGHRAKIQVELALAHSALEIADPTRPPVSEVLLQEALDGGMLADEHAFHMMALLTSARMHLLGGATAEANVDRIALAGQRIEEASAVLIEMEQGGLGDLLPLREVALFHALAADLALADQAEPDELRGVLQVFEQALMDYIATWSQVPAAPGGIGILHDARRRVILDSYFGLCFALGEGERALATLLKIQTEGTMARSLGVADTDLVEIRKQLVGDGAILVYLPTFTRTQLWIIDQDDVVMELLTGGSELRTLNRELGFLPPEQQPDSEAARALGGELLPDTLHQKLATWSHVYVAGADLLDNPPFEILPFGDSSLGREVPIVHLPSLPIGVHLARRTAAPKLAGQEALALFAGPQPSDEALERWPSIGPISVEGGSWEDLTDSFSKGKSKAWIEEQATRVALLERFGPGASEADETKVLSLFCHGVFDFETEDLPAGLVLGASAGDNGLVWASDVTGELRAPELVVLAACGTSRGPQRRGENGMANLGGAFLHAGASTVILAGGSLGVEAAFELTKVLHRELARGETVAEALRMARHELGQRYGNEGLGVPLSILGVGHLPLFLPPEETDRPLIPWALGALVFVGAGFLLLRRRQTASA